MAPYLKHLVVILLTICDGKKASYPSKTIQRNQPKPFLSKPKLTELDAKIIRTALPTVANFAINPLVGSITLYYVGKMKNALALAGMSAANQVYFSAFILFSYLPSITGTLVSTEHAKENKDGIMEAVCQSMALGILLSSIASIVLFSKPKYVLGSVLSKDASAMSFAEPYLMIRSLSVVPSIIGSISFAAFRGVFDPDTPLYITLLCSAINVLLHPLFIFKYDMGVSGAALATLTSEILSSIMFLYILHKRDMISVSKLLSIPSWNKLSPLLKGGAALQLRNISINIVFIYVSRVVQSLDDEGIAASAHSMTYQIFSLGGIVLLALSVVAQTLVPSELIPKVSSQGIVGGKEDAKILVNRMMAWGLLLGSLLGSLQLLLLPFLHTLTPIAKVQQLAKYPCYIACIAQFINGLVFVGEGVMVGCKDFLQLSLGTVVATIGAIIALQIFPNKFGLSGVWMSFIVLNLVRLGFVYVHQEIIGPFNEEKI